MVRMNKDVEFPLFDGTGAVFTHKKIVISNRVGGDDCAKNGRGIGDDVIKKTGLLGCVGFRRRGKPGTLFALNTRHPE
jgi:hypothetical protein